MSSPTFEARPWGSFTVLDDAMTHKVKTLTVNPGQRLSYQRHQKRAEHWFVVAGTATVTIDDLESSVAQGEYIDIPTMAWHRIENRGASDLVFVEVQHGSYFGEDDIERRSDDYGRA
ncbi:MAG: phosphomannose isomerase type II C-terminal cupin domain [Acidimicrobiales bacterium]